MNDFSARFIEARTNAHLSVSEIAKKFGVSPQAVYGWQKGSVPDADKMNALADMLRVPLQWLAYGTGDPVPVSAEDGSVSVPLLDVEVSAGGGQVPDMPKNVVRMLSLDPEWIAEKMPFVSRNSLRVFTVSGDSMEPTLNDEDVLLVDGSVNRITREGIYVVLVDGMLFSKRFQPTTGSRMLMISDNKLYRDVELNLADESLQFSVLGRVIYSWKGERH